MLKVKRLTEDATLPTRAHHDDVGLDLYASEDVLLPAGSFRTVGTGIAVAFPVGYVGSVRPRSGLAAKWGVTCLNAPGTIDPGYRGEVKVILVNHSEHHYQIEKGHKVAQLVMELVGYLPMVEVAELDESERGEGGLGSTGV